VCKKIHVDFLEEKVRKEATSFAFTNSATGKEESLHFAFQII